MFFHDVQRESPAIPQELLSYLQGTYRENENVNISFVLIVFRENNFS